MDSIQQRLTPPLFKRRLKRQRSYNALKTATPRSIAYPSYPLFKSLLFTCFKLAGLYNHCRKQANNIEVNQHTFTLPNLSSDLQGFTILHLSDLHLDTNPELANIICTKLSSLTYDITVITGDFFEHTKNNKGAASEHLIQILQSIKSPLYGILGNHDSIELVPFLEQHNMHVLLNETKIIKHKSASLGLAGIDDPHFYRTHDLPKVSSAIPASIPSILLAHSSVVFFEASQLEFNIMLSGHSHGGQLCLPGGIPVLNNSRSPRYMIAGPWHYKKLQGYTSRGTGCNILPLRLFCLPEITLHTLMPCE